MKHVQMRGLVIICIVGLLALWGCPKSTDVTDSSDTQKQGTKSTNKTSSEMKASNKNETMNESVGMSSSGLKPIYFDSGKSYIRKDARAALKANAEWLKANPKVSIIIAGNCDERGEKDFNKALGKRRSDSAKKYLVGLGISATRISTISNGGEKPVCTEHNVACWQKNSRADFMSFQ
jgi:peptidoglycan-associated lipoprotein